MKRIGVVPGDGIGIDVTRESLRILRLVNEMAGGALEFVEFDWGADKFLKEGISLPAGACEMFRKDFDARAANFSAFAIDQLFRIFFMRSSILSQQSCLHFEKAGQARPVK